MPDLSPVPVPRQSSAITPATAWKRLSIYRTTKVSAFTIHEFWKIGAKPGSSMSVLNDPDVVRQCATITFYANKPGRFTLSFYPNKEAPQIVQDLPMEKLGEAAMNLIAAGFPTIPEPVVTAPRRQSAKQLPAPQ
jgi:hypothetical protein